MATGTSSEINREMTDIKSMKLYTHVDRVCNELREIGKSDTDPLRAEELSSFDQLHYHGTAAVDHAISELAISSGTSVLEIGSGIGGPARHIASRVGARVTALELQSDHNDLAADLTERCGLSDKIDHVCGDFLTHDWAGQTFDVIVSWLALYHIPDHQTLLEKSFAALNPRGAFHTEDLISRRPFSDDELSELSTELFANHLVELSAYEQNLENAGFTSVSSQDMSDDWAAFSGDRIKAYEQQRDRHVRVHGENVVSVLSSFYGVVDRYLSSGQLGGIRVVAQKPKLR